MREIITRWNISRCGISHLNTLSVLTTMALSLYSSFPPLSCFYFLLQLFSLPPPSSHFSKQIFSVLCGLLSAGWGFFGISQFFCICKIHPFIFFYFLFPFLMCLFLCFHPSTCQLLGSQALMPIIPIFIWANWQ